MRNRLRPAFDTLGPRTLPTAGITVALSQGILTVHRTDASQPLAIDILTTPLHPASQTGVRGLVVIEGIARFRAVRVQSIDVDPGATSSGVIIRQSSTAPIPVDLLEPITLAPAPVATPTPTPTPTPSPSPSPTTTPTTTQVITPDETGMISAMGQQIVDLTNAQRAAVGLPALVVNSGLVLAAQIHAHDMAALDDMDHTLSGVALSTLQDRANYVNYTYAWLGENIAEGFTDAATVMNAWMNSPGHKANILETNFTDIGVGISADASGVLYFSVEFGSRQS